MDKPPDENEPKPPRRSLPRPDPDAYLHIWVYLANRLGLEASLSMTMGGVVVSGTLISIETWQREMESQIRAANTETPDAVEGMLKGLTEARIRITADELVEDPDKEYQFVHLKEATVYGAGSPFEVPLWRGNIHSVDSWWLGHLA